METFSGIQYEYGQVRDHCGYFFLEDRKIIGASGKDTLDFLQTQTTNDVNQLTSGSGQNSAIVDRKGKLIASFSLHKSSEDSILFLIETCQKENLTQHLKTFIFREDIEIERPLLQNTLLTIQGPKSALLLEKCDPKIQLPAKPNDLTFWQWSNTDLMIINKSLAGEEGYVIALPKSFANELESLFMAKGEPLGLTLIGPETQEILRIEAGIPKFGRDMDKTHILPETGLEHTSVSYNKGCYIGQEVIARIKTYGSPPQALMGLVFEEYDLPPYNSEIRLQNRKIGTIKSSSFSYFLSKNIALAYIQKDHRSPDQKLLVEINGLPFKIKTALLPFYQTKSRSDHARVLHHEALIFFKDEENLEKPISLLRDAIELDPKYASAYEALGVLLSRQNKLDEAISLMKRLAEIDPNEIMAHTNLSIYYMKQGRIEDAEQEKAEATALQFEKIMADKIAQKSKERLEEEKREDQEKKVGMFQEVLKIDPKDQVANFGLGSIYLDNGKYQAALEHLKILVEHYPDYSVAYNLLGRTFENLSQKEDALEIYQKGIAVASKKGDLMPLKEMQSRRNQLLQSSPS